MDATGKFSVENELRLGKSLSHPSQDGSRGVREKKI